MKHANTDITITNAPTSNRDENRVTMNDDTSRLDGVAKVTGRAKYGMDKTQDGTLIAAYVRCPWGRAELTGASVDAAKAVPGVVAVRLDDAIGGEYTYHGQNAGYLVAENLRALRRGLRALKPQWKRLDALADIEDANPSWPEATSEDRERVEGKLENAAATIDSEYSTQVQTHSSLETHGGRVDFRGDHAVVYGSTQSNYGFRDDVAATLELPTSSVEMHCEYVGGGFGSKFGAGKEGKLAALVSKEFGRPCHVFCDRMEEHLDTGNRPSSRQRFTLGADRNGKVLGGFRLTLGGVGVGGRGGGVSGVRYDFGDLISEHRDISFNGGGPRAMRAPGHPQGMFAVELALDELAAQLDMDPLELRRVNETSEARKKMYDLGADLIGWSNRGKNGSQNGPIRVGYGMGVTDWPNIQTSAECEVVIHPDGSVEARSGTQDIGTGHRTCVAIVCADTLGVPLEVVSGKVGSTEYPPGPASGGSMTAPNTAPAMMEAADDAKKKLLEKIAERNNLDAQALDIRNGSIVRGDETIMNWSEACAALPSAVVGRGDYRRGTDPHYHGEGHSDGVQFARVEVDTETGVIKVDKVIAIQACGKIMCRKTAESQIIGGVIQGVSFALFENKLLDGQTAAMVNPNFDMYKIAGTVDIPDIVPVLWDDGATGVRSLGEPPVIPTPGAIACAVYNAIGAPVRSMPLTPDKVLAAVAAASKGGA
ncbi:MAG: xanthine dehydrogenase family protein molybdopterin-binding subunit [Phycisphaerales bacterium]